MINEATIRASAVVIYLSSLVILLTVLRRVPEERRALCYPVVLVLGVASVGTALTTFGIGNVVVNGTEVLVPKVIDDILAYSLLWVVTARLANVDGRLLVFVTVTPVVQRLAFTVASVSSGLLALFSVTVVVGGLVAFAYIFLTSVWEDTQSLPQQRRLLHWKGRNLLLFLIGMLVVYGLLTLLGVFDTVVQETIRQYMSILIRVGFAGFLLANLDAIGTTSLVPRTASTDNPTG